MSTPEEPGMTTVATMVSRSPIFWDGEQAGFIAAVLTDGRHVRGVGEGGEARALVRRARQVLRPGPDPARVLYEILRRSVSSYESASPPWVFDGELDEAAAQLGEELGLPVVMPSPVPAVS